MVKKKKKINIKLKKLNNRDREAMDDQKIFINYFREKINFINGLKIEKNARIFKKIIYVSILDALSKTIYPNYSNRKRFVLFIEEFSGWKYSSKVSIPHFIKMLKLAPEPEFSKLREYVYLIYESWKKGDVITLDKDIDIQKIYKFWPNNSEKKIRGIKTESLKHSHLFYENRCALIHELRQQGNGIERESKKEKKECFYSFMSWPDKPEQSTWELIYPEMFFKKICEDSLDKLNNYYKYNKLNPFDYFTFGSYWLEELN